MKSVLTTVLILLIGVSSGWTARTVFFNKTERMPSEQYPVSISQSEHNPAVTSQQNAANKKEDQALGEEDLMAVDNEQGSFDAENTSRSNTLDHYFRKMVSDPKYRIHRDQELRAKILENPLLALDILRRAQFIENESHRFSAEFLAEILNSQHRPFLEPYLIDAIKNGEDTSLWLEHLGRWGLQSKTNIGYLYEQLDRLENPQDIGHSLNAISKSSWAINSAFSPQERRSLTTKYVAYFDHEHPSVRAAAIKSLRSFPQKDSSQALVQGLQDESYYVNAETISFLEQNPVDSAQMRHTLSSTIDRKNLPLSLQNQYLRMLLKLAISPHERSVVEARLASVDEQLGSLTQDQREGDYELIRMIGN